MKHLRRFCALATLICAFAFSTYAGNIPCDGIISPPPPSATATGNIECPAIAAIVILIETVLSLP
ncbi:MAG TPA: hypothetical protein VF543_02515 [Pyrinomonadaceae bacterium]